MVQVEKVGGPALGAGGAVGVQSLQIFGVAGHPGDRGHVGVVSCGVLGGAGASTNWPCCPLHPDNNPMQLPTFN
ncbi:hypothetical protein GCM10009609_22900 [Pseudonocardia aurantiaca]